MIIHKVTLTAEQTAQWRDPNGAKFRVSLKRPARIAAEAAGTKACVFLANDGTFLEECLYGVRGCDEQTPERAMLWFGSVPWHPSTKDVENARLDFVEASARAYDGLMHWAAWRLEAMAATAAAPGCDLSPGSETGRAVLAAANARLLAFATSRE